MTSDDTSWLADHPDRVPAHLVRSFPAALVIFRPAATHDPVGEVVSSGPQVVSGYRGQSQPTDDALPGGRRHAGSMVPMGPKTPPGTQSRCELLRTGPDA